MPNGINELIENEGNAATKILARAYSEFAKGGITQNKIDEIEKLDDIVKGAKILINNQNGFAQIVQEDGKVFELRAGEFSAKPNKEITFGSKDKLAIDKELLLVFGNADAKILAEAYFELSKNGLTVKEREKLEKLDEVLKDADMMISKDGNMATIIQTDGSQFQFKMSKNGKGK